MNEILRFLFGLKLFKGRRLGNEHQDRHSESHCYLSLIRNLFKKLPLPATVLTLSLLSATSLEDFVGLILLVCIMETMSP